MLSRFERSTPEAEGVSSKGLKACLDRLCKLAGDDQMNSFMVLRHGKVIHENYWRPYNAELPHKLFSLSKSFTSTAVGLAISEGLFGLDDHVTDLFADKMPAVISDHLKEMTVRHLLTMSCGQKMCYATKMMVEGVQDWQKAFFEQEIPYKPGTTFVYNSLGTYMLSALVTRKTGLNLVDYLMPRLFEPLGIARPVWETCPAGISTGGWGLYPDEGSEGLLMENNLVYNTMDGSFHQHYGEDNVITNNVFALGGEGALRSSYTGAEHQLGYDDPDNHNEFTLKRNIFLTDNTPVFAEFGNNDFIDEGNIYWDLRNHSHVFCNWWSDPNLFTRVFERGIKKLGHFTDAVLEDPGFLDPADDDYTLPDINESLDKIGFERFDYESAGTLTQR